MTQEPERSSPALAWHMSRTATEEIKSLVAALKDENAPARRLAGEMLLLFALLDIQGERMAARINSHGFESPYEDAHEACVRALWAIGLSPVATKRLKDTIELDLMGATTAAFNAATNKLATQALQSVRALRSLSSARGMTL